MPATSIWIVFSALVLLPSVTLGQDHLEDDDPLVSDRPDFTESALTIAPGRFQVEAGFTRATAEGTDLTEIGEVLVRVGVAANTEVRLGLGSWLQESGGREGFANPALGLKQRLLRGEDARPELAVIATTTLPIGSDEVASDQNEPEVVAAAQWNLGGPLGLGVNLGWSSRYVDSDDHRFASTWLSASLGLAASETVGLYLEGFGLDREETGGDSTGYLNGGATWLLHADLQLDVRYGHGLNGRDDEWFAGAGLVVRR